MTDDTRAQVPELTADLVFARLEELRAVLRLTEYLRQFRPGPTPPSPPRG